ncbi:MAG: hypothetical protein M1819_001862 [Sarea resinae]|nr:MAG: hypothetical protein M1819_001862 [Sarea resinae]
MPAPVQQLQSQTSGSYGRGSNNGYASPSHSYSVDSVPRYSSAGPGPSPPPPQNYVYGAPPPQRYTTTSPHAVDSRIPPSPQPWANEGTQPSLFPLFKAVDKMGTGQLTEKELKTALVNGDYTSFDPHTVRMMIRMFDTDRSGTINYDEFCGLWGFLASWRSLFDRFDEDRSGNISYDEYSRALVGVSTTRSDSIS